LLVTANGVRFEVLTTNVVPSSSIFVTLMMEAILSSETSVLTRTTRRNIPGGGIVHTCLEQLWIWLHATGDCYSDCRGNTNLHINSFRNDVHHGGRGEIPT
jgi:hypothetical protein